MAELLTAESLIALLTLTALEIVLGIDNVVFIAILVAKLPAAVQKKARTIGLSLAMILRIVLLMSIQWIMTLTEPAFSIASKGFSGRDLILLLGGLFLVWKATKEIHEKVLHDPKAEVEAKAPPSFRGAIIQIILLDLVFSLDSVITAVGMAKQISVMVIAVVIAVAVMMVFAGAVSRFVENNPTIKMLALSFLLLIGVMLLVEGWGGHVEKGYIYFAMGFSLFVEILNLRVIKRHVITKALADHGRSRTPPAGP